jgi:hypothetical protein
MRYTQLLVAMSKARFILIVFVAFSALTSYALSQNQNSPSQNDRPGSVRRIATDQSPIVVRVLPSSKSHEEIAQEAKENKRKVQNDRWIIGIGVGQLVIFFSQLIVFWLQLLAFRDQANKLRQTVPARRRSIERHEAVSRAFRSRSYRHGAIC